MFIHNRFTSQRSRRHPIGSAFDAAQFNNDALLSQALTLPLRVQMQGARLRRRSSLALHSGPQFTVRKVEVALSINRVIASPS